MEDDTRWLDVDEANAWLGLVAVMELLPAALDSQLIRDAQLTFFEFLTLAQLAEVPEHELRLTDLAGGTNASLPRISRVVARLERAGLVERRHDEFDARARNVRLTEAGWDKLAEASPGHVRLVNECFAKVLSREQIAQLSGICDRIVEALDPDRRLLAESFRGRNGRPGLSRAVTTREFDHE